MYNKIFSRSLFLLMVTCTNFSFAQGKYDNLRDPFTRPGPPDKPVVGPKNIGRGIDAESGGKPPGAKPENATSSPSAVSFVFATYGFVNEAWRPTTLFIAGETKSVAAEKATIAFVDILKSYFTGPGWASKSVAWMGPKVISRLFTVYSILEPSELSPTSEISHYSDLGPGKEKLFDYFKRLHEQRLREESESKLEPGNVPYYLRNPASDDGGSSDVSLEIDRRRAIFSDQSLTKDGTIKVVGTAASKLFGATAGQFTEDWLWLFDGERIKTNGLSKNAVALFDESQLIIAGFKAIYKKRHQANACTVYASPWLGGPVPWACGLPPSNFTSSSCYCPGALPGQIFNGTPHRYERGLVCNIPGVGICPMVRSEPEGTTCTCSGYAGYIGLVR
ncbi:hypothetical protein [Massilia sp. TWP1-3-3]|uniref:hypothetical protein n=1 Tax=Massilia sp. TWP1-3-3 TaxID=2804573 RepID=UPI003CE70838